MESSRAASYNIDAALYILPRYLHQLEIPGADLEELRSSACHTMEDFLRATEEGQEISLDRTKWLILRALLKSLENSLQTALDRQMNSDPSIGSDDVWTTNKSIFDVIENVDKIQVEVFESSTPTSVKIASLRRNPETARLQAELKAYTKKVEDLQTDLKTKSDVVDRLVLQGDAGKVSDLEGRLAALNWQYAQEQRQRKELKEKLQGAKKDFDEKRKKMEEDMAVLQEKYENTFRELLIAQKLPEELQKEIEKANLQLGDQQKVQEEVKTIVQRIENKQEDFIQEVHELHLEATEQRPGSGLEGLPTAVNGLCTKIEYFIGSDLAQFGGMLLEGDFIRGRYETDRACFATCQVFWKLIQDWLEKRPNDVTEEKLRAACEALRSNPLERKKMSNTRKEQLEKNYGFLSNNVVLVNLLPALRETGLSDIEGEVKRFISNAKTKAEKLERLLQVVFSKGDAGFDSFIKALSQSHPDFVPRQITFGMQQEAAEEEEGNAPEEPAAAATAPTAEEGGPGQGAPADEEEEEEEDQLAELAPGDFGAPGAAGLSVGQLAQVMMSMCRTILHQQAAQPLLVPPPAPQEPPQAPP